MGGCRERRCGNSAPHKVARLCTRQVNPSLAFELSIVSSSLLLLQTSKNSSIVFSQLKSQADFVDEWGSLVALRHSSSQEFVTRSDTRPRRQPTQPSLPL